MQLIIYNDNNEISLIVNDAKDVVIYSDGVAIESGCAENLCGDMSRYLSIKEE